MKKIFLTSLAALALLATPLARAWNYTDGDVLLVFRGGTQNIEFDLGSVTNFIGKTNGYTTTVTGWNVGLVTGKFGTDLTGIKVVLVATRGSTNFLSSAEPNVTAYNVSGQAANTLQGVISAVGTSPLYPINIPSNSINAYSIDTGGQYAYAAYDQVVTGGGVNTKGIAKLGGNAPFNVEQAIPGFLDFWATEPTLVYPGSPPDQLLGTFYITTNGVLTFVAGPRPSTVTAVSHAGNVSALSFTTTVGNSYSVAYTNRLVRGSAPWPVDASTTLVGNGRINTVTQTNAGSAEFYRIATQ
jgi:hypothetical protein